MIGEPNEQMARGFVAALNELAFENDQEIDRSVGRERAAAEGSAHRRGEREEIGRLMERQMALYYAVKLISLEHKLAPAGADASHLLTLRR